MSTSKIEKSEIEKHLDQDRPRDTIEKYEKLMNGGEECFRVKFEASRDKG
jgi:hypothetical protein